MKFSAALESFQLLLVCCKYLSARFANGIGLSRRPTNHRRILCCQVRVSPDDLRWLTKRA